MLLLNNSLEKKVLFLSNLFLVVKERYIFKNLLIQHYGKIDKKRRTQKKINFSIISFFFLLFLGKKKMEALEKANNCQ